MLALSLANHIMQYIPPSFLLKEKPYETEAKNSELKYLFHLRWKLICLVALNEAKWFPFRFKAKTKRSTGGGLAWILCSTLKIPHLRKWLRWPPPKTASDLLIDGSLLPCPAYQVFQWKNRLDNNWPRESAK